MAKKAATKRAKLKTVKKATPAKAKAPVIGGIMPTLPDIPADTIRLERLGEVREWRIPSAPYSNQKNLRLAYRGGFNARATKWGDRDDSPAPLMFTAGTALQRAFEDGFNDARRQEGAAATSKPKKLVGEPV